MANPNPSLSRELQPESAPRLLHSLHEVRSSVLSLQADERHIFSGSQSPDISVWSKKTYQLNTMLRGHTGSVLALELSKEREWLISSSGDSTIRVWSTQSLTPLYVLQPYLETGAGDLFSLAWCKTLEILYIGCQNTSLQWYSFQDHHPETSSNGSNSGTSTPSSMRKAHKFFDSYPQYQHKPADLFANNGSQTPPIQPSAGTLLEIPAENVIDSAHYGYIYCMALLTREDSTGQKKDIQLATGSGDESVKLWATSPEGPTLIYTLPCGQGAILSLVVRGETIYAGCQEGVVKVWDLETKTVVRRIMVQEGIDIISLSLLNTDLYTCSANGKVHCWNASFDCTASWPAHEDAIALSSIVTNGRGRNELNLITGGSDDYIRIWEVTPPTTRDGLPNLSDSSSVHADVDPDIMLSDAMVYALAKFISIPSVSSSNSTREDCRQAAIWLKKCLNQLGAQATLLPTSERTNPIVLATFSGSHGSRPNPRVLFYGHYDVIEAASTEAWGSDPFTLTGRNGYLYGRGATDNKGPIMAVAFAAAELLGRRALELDLVFLIEGEEEYGSGKFAETVKQHKDAIGHIDAILVSNSTWIAEDSPCITYGLRGVVHCAVEISSNHPDMHSGIEGGAVVEPMLDMIKLLATLADDAHKVRLPNFYDRVRAQTQEETQLYARLSDLIHRPAASLSARWREPSLTVHNIEIGGPNNSTVIPGKVRSQVSLRIVPDQDLDTIAESLCDYLYAGFKAFQSPNTLEVKVDNRADWWLGSLDDPWFKALEGAVRDEWGVEPLRIREGGSIPSVPYLEKEFGCHALHLPLGQSSDQAHLPNERISLSNLQRGKSVVERFFLAVAQMTSAIPQ